MNPEDYGLEVTVEIVTPEQAGKYLLNNAHHREVSPKRVNKYVNALEAGEWKLNGKVLIFDENGTLRNGQHRLHAVVQSGQNLTTLIVRGVKVSAFNQEAE